MNDYLKFESEKVKKKSLFFQIIFEFFYFIEYTLFVLIGPFWPLLSHKTGDKRPVVLIPGFLGRPLYFHRLRRHLIKEGYPVYCPSFGFQIGNIHKKSLKLANYLVDKNLKNCYLICHSMGGLIALNLNYKGRDRLYKVITLGSPLHGTYMAFLALWSVAGWQMIPRSPFLRKIRNLYPTFSNIQSVFSVFDEIILEKKRARLDRFDDVQVAELGHLNLGRGSMGIDCIKELLRNSDNSDPYRPPKTLSAKASSDQPPGSEKSIKVQGEKSKVTMSATTSRKQEKKAASRSRVTKNAEPKKTKKSQNSKKTKEAKITKKIKSSKRPETKKKRK